MHSQPKTRRVTKSAFYLGMLGGLAALSACGGAPPSADEQVAKSSADLLATACTYDAAGDVTLKS